MRDYILFIDTETSGIPKNWNAPYFDDGAWPHVVQIAWEIFSQDGTRIKSENHYIQAVDFQVDPASVKVHGLDERFLNENGEKRADVFRALASDLAQYQPLIVGHFVEFDNHMMEMGFRRAGLEYPGRDLPKFCTMTAGRIYGSRFYRPRSLRLDELYAVLFQKPLENHHDAQTDARATADCFFEMLKKGDIARESISAQASAPAREKNYALFWVILFFILFIITIIAC